MTNEQPHSGSDILHGLLAGNPEALDFIYTTYKQPVVRLVTLAGGSSADGVVFFRTALLELAQMLRNGQIDHDVPLPDAIRSLAIAHYESWLHERDQPLPDTPEATEMPKFELPSDAQLKQTRRSIFTWKQLDRLPKAGRVMVISALGAQKSNAEIAAETGKTEAFVAAQKPVYLAEFGKNFQHAPASASATWPDWALEALRDNKGLHLWQQIQATEQRLDKVTPAASGRSNAVARNVFIAMILITLGYAAWQYINRPKPAENIYAENFEPPKSIQADMEARYGVAASSNDSIQANLNTCLQVFHVADAFYSRGELNDAKDHLAEIAGDPFSVCQNDALFYLGIVYLMQDEPDPALVCLSKIDNLEAYGEEIYWYQALCFVKLTVTYPGLRDKAARAVERFLSQTQNESRRALAEKMLNDLRN